MISEIFIKGELDVDVLEEMGFDDVTGESSNLLYVSSRNALMVKECCEINPMFKPLWIALGVGSGEVGSFFSQAEVPTKFSYLVEYEGNVILHLRRDEKNWMIEVRNIDEREVLLKKECRAWSQKDENTHHISLFRKSTTPFSEVIGLVEALNYDLKILQERLSCQDLGGSLPSEWREKFKFYSVYIGEISNRETIRKFSSDKIDIIAVKEENFTSCVFFGEGIENVVKVIEKYES